MFTTISITAATDGRPHLLGRAMQAADAGRDAVPAARRYFEADVPCGGEHAVYFGDAPEDVAQRFAGAIRQQGQAAGLDLTVRVLTSPAATIPTPGANTVAELCWECGTEIAPGHGVVDAMGWAHRSCVGA